MNRNQIKQARVHLAKENSKYPDHLVEVPRDSWPNLDAMTNKPIHVFRSRFFMVQVFKEGEHTRLSINRSDIDDQGRWREKIPWEDLQELKRQAGYGDSLAVEVYPKERDIVNVANMRHLWIVPVLDVGWKA